MSSTTLSSGPWKQVRNTRDPLDDPADMLQDALNIYLPDPASGCGAYQRPAFIYDPAQGPFATSRRVNGVCVRASTGTNYNFTVGSGKLYRQNGSLAIWDDVTPVGITITNDPSLRVFLYAYGDNLICTDGVNRPWVGTNLGGSPITGTYIDIDGAGGSWTAFGPPTMYSGVLIFMPKTVPVGSSARARVSIIWCEPNQPLVGYVQTGYTDFANIIQTSGRPLTGIWGTNNYLAYWRDSEIGTAAGIVDGSFASTFTGSSISKSIGLLAPATIAQYGDTIYFCDQFGRPQRLVIGETLTEPQIWLQLRQDIETQTQAAGYQSMLEQCAVGVVEPNLNLYLCAPYASGSFGTNNYPPTTIYAFDAKTGNYVGQWSIGAGCGIAGLWLLADISGGTSDVLTTAAAMLSGANWVTRLWVQQLTRISAAQWTDSIASQTVSVTTGRLGYQSDIIYKCGDTATAITMNAASVALTVQTPYTASDAVGTIAPATSYDSTFRVVWGCDTNAAREVRMTMTPTLSAAQWGIQQAKIIAVPARAGREDA